MKNTIKHVTLLTFCVGVVIAMSAFSVASAASGDLQNMVTFGIISGVHLYAIPLIWRRARLPLVWHNGRWCEVRGPVSPETLSPEASHER